MTNDADADLWTTLRARTTANVYDRISRLNPTLTPGETPRGDHRKRTARDFLFLSYYSYATVIADHGKAVWAAIPTSKIHKDGRRRYAPWSAIRNTAVGP